MAHTGNTGGFRIGSGRKAKKELLANALFRYSANTVLKALRDTSIDREKRIEWSIRILGRQLSQDKDEKDRPLLEINALILKLEALDERGIENLITSGRSGQIQASPIGTNSFGLSTDQNQGRDNPSPNPEQSPVNAPKEDSGTT